MKKILIMCLFITLCSLNLFSGPHYLYGNITRITSTKEGLMIQLDTGVPDNCTGSYYNWLLIRQEYKVMVEVALLAWKQKIPVIVYCDGIGYSGFGEINQVDPAD
ncbi:MAG: hypothetical protein JXB88_07645 [Spirochaetales bacterium]|nr:hypothetical protein [Spirochaetales bacterium]